MAGLTESCAGQVSSTITLGTPEVAYNPQRITRKRLLELTTLAKETCEYLEKKGLQKGEQCVFRRIAEEMWFTE